MPGFLNEVLIRGIAREQVPPMFELAEHDKHTVLTYKSRRVVGGCGDATEKVPCVVLLVAESVW